MAHRKKEYTASGHEVTIQQVNEGGVIRAWIDGYAAHLSAAIESFPLDVSGLTQWKACKRALAFMVDTDVYFCKECETFYDSSNVVRTHFAGHTCASCDASDKHCPDNPDGDSHEDECLNPRQRRNARVSTKYKCIHCGRKRKTTPTG